MASRENAPGETEPHSQYLYSWKNLKKIKLFSSKLQDTGLKIDQEIQPFEMLCFEKFLHWSIL